ncbi:ethanolamine ammonia-lyase subunit EutC [Desulfovibrio ferrophilus]|uniref:Ethanolamine ammonia-lyase small subunit n=1 Tax=Desulfovibrio ferrophilus TaxID=241368 RepID=A0A2Z6AUS4_9BACT|nr:ethanolamine ammonia-lyase subunit EutC [Desulfovibrio ferrophilus]BBD06992.1 ethanolamine ammonia-lyase [Desulfovibrio ferrophilus]
MSTRKTPATTQKSTDSSQFVTADPWTELKCFTDARIGLGRCGTSLPLSESLSFKLAHAQARDAVHQPFKIDELAHGLEIAGIRHLRLNSAVADREEYLTRPDKGRKLSTVSREFLETQVKDFDLCLVIADGLSSRAIHENALSFARGFLGLTKHAALSVAPVCLVENGRVAVADEIASILQAEVVVILIGERPGLSSPNSLGVYMTYNAKPGTTDEARNCISNVREGGLSIKDGVQKLAYLMEEALRIKTSGVALKDKMPANHLPFGIALTALTKSEDAPA